jgi:hypothetical protein
VHPSKGYSVFWNKGKKYMMASQTFDKYATAFFPHGKVSKLEVILGESLVNFSVLDPVTMNAIPIIMDDSITDSITFIAPHSPSTNITDFKLSEEANLDRSPGITPQGRLLSANAKIDQLSLFETATEGLLLYLSSIDKIINYKEDWKSQVYRHHTEKDRLLML